MNLIFLLACHSLTEDETGDSIADTSSDSGEPSGEPSGDTSADTSSDTAGETGDTHAGLSLCAVWSMPLEQTWVSTFDDRKQALDHLDYRDGLLAGIEGAAELIVLDVPADGGEPTLRNRKTTFETWHDLYLTDWAEVVAAGDWSVGYWSLSSSEFDSNPWPENDVALRSIAPGPDGGRVTGPDFTASFVVGGGTGNELSSGLDSALVVGGDTDHAWIAGLVGGNPAVALGRSGGDAAYGPPVEISGVFGESTAILPLADGAVVIGGPEGYGWVARLDDSGALVNTIQFESPGLNRISGGGNGAYAWSFFDGLGLFAFSPDLLGYDILTEGGDIVDLVVDPDDNWIITSHEDGSLRAWVCPEE